MDFGTTIANIAKLLRNYWKVFLLEGVPTTLLLTCIAVALGTILGTLIAMMKMSKSKINSKYSTFLSGDAPLVRIINNDLPDAGNVLIIKDSFGNAMAPFFTQNYHTVYVVDYRYYPKSLSNLVGSLGINDIIFLPNISDLQTRAVGDLLQKYKK